MKENRLMYVDIAKGIGIILVAIFHIYAFNMNINRGIIVVYIFISYAIILYCIKERNNIKKFIISNLRVY